MYGILHSTTFRETFAVNLRKEAPRIPLVTDRAAFDAFAAAGQDLIDLHIGYETVVAVPAGRGVVVGFGSTTNPDVLLVGSKKMRYPKVTDPDSG